MRSRYLFTILAWALLGRVLAVAPPGCGVCGAYCEDWSGPTHTLSQWTQVGQSVTVGPVSFGGQGLHFDEQVVDWGALVYDGMVSSDVDMQVSVPYYQIGSMLTNIQGGMLNPTWCDACYEFAADPGLQTVAIGRLNGVTEGFQLLGSAPLPPATGLSYLLRARKAGGLLEFYVDGVLLLSVTDPTPLPAGKAALHSLLADPGIAHFGAVTLVGDPCTPTVTPTSTPSWTQTLTVSPSPTVTPTPSDSQSPSSTVSATPTLSASPTVTASPSITRTPTLTGTALVIASPTPSPSSTATPSITATFSASPSPLPSSGEEGEVRAYPNPVGGEVLHLTFGMKGQGYVALKVWNAAAQLCATMNESFGPGPQALHLPVGNYASGTYLYQLTLAYQDGRKVAFPVKRFTVLP